ncbi:uncharacterized protein LOC121276821 [Carcharodon carcharias]|uniref:uncharacterized protein LOC121276821 n=1 Tax=Carcharodon carcharias TaxID=13397 RepID=UPI001B7DA82A|nr:uncharacterized protein LOC121276821 [Carcharodon carcharias]
MTSLYFLLSVVLLSALVQSYKISVNNWTMMVADDVRVREGGSAILPCSFTHPHIHRRVNGSVMWYKLPSDLHHPVFKCTYPGTDHSQGELCENVTQRDSGNRSRFVGNLSSNDLSIMMEQLSRKDTGQYRCRVELNVGKFETPSGTNLTVEVVGRNDSVVSGTEGDSVTLPCMFIPNNSLTLTTVTWIRKEPYQHVVTFRDQLNRSRIVVSAGNRYKLVGNPQKGNLSIRINQLNMTDNRTYLCVVEYTGLSYYQYLIQNETRLHGCSSLIGCTRSLKRKDPGSSMTARTDQAHQKSAPEQGDSNTYAEIERGRTGGKRFTISASEDRE